MLTGKPALRARLRAERDSMAGRDPVAAPAAFADRLRPGSVVASYGPTGGEADPDAFEAAVMAASGQLALPYVVDRASPLRFLAWPRGAPLATGPFGLSNPQPDWPAVAPDIILTPLVGFDRRGTRLGQGAGHYDRAFVAYPQAWRVGIAWSVQEVEALPADPWDVPLHAIATEREWIEVA